MLRDIKKEKNLNSMDLLYPSIKTSFNETLYYYKALFLNSNNKSNIKYSIHPCIIASFNL